MAALLRIVMRGARAFYSPDVAADDRLPNFGAGAQKRAPRTLIAVPLRPGSKPAGFLYLNSWNPSFSYDRWSLILLSLLVRCAVPVGKIKNVFPKT